MKTKHILALIAGVLLTTLAVLASGVSMPTTSSETINSMEADYPLYERLGDLVAQSSIVIRGRVTGLRPSYRVIPEGIPLDKLPDHKKAQVGYLMTDVEVEVERVLSGSSDLLNTRVVVIHPGGDLAGQKYVMEGEPMSENGQTYVLFLEQVGAGRYVIVGGAQGRYIVRNGKLTSLSNEARNLPVNKSLDAISLAAFEKDFLQLASRRGTQPQVPETDEPLTILPANETPLSKPDAPPSPEGSQP
jgi:hypothetical protein